MAPQESLIVLGRLEVDIGRRELREAGSVIPVGSRAFDLLVLLLQARGEMVTKDDILHNVWGGAAVGDNVLHVPISAIRRILGADQDALKTVSGRGYRLLRQGR